MSLRPSFWCALACAGLGAVCGTGVSQAAPNTYWKIELLHSFDAGTGGYLPYAGLVESGAGVFWGTTSLGGGRGGSGAVYRFTPGTPPEVMHTFAGDGSGGGRPMAALLPVGRVLYGSTALGGSQQKGTLFKLSTLGSFTLLHSFTGGEGTEPRAALVRGSDGKFYGTTRLGGAHLKGTAFRMDSTGAVTTLRSFGTALGSGNDGEMPMAPLMQQPDGFFYGTTVSGGAYGGGVLYRLSASGAYTLLKSLGEPGAPSSAGCSPHAGLAPGPAGALVGTTTGCGSAAGGTVFSATPAGAVTWLHSFVPATHGAPPEGELVQRSDGRYYGATQDGALGCGSVFAKTLSGAFTRLVAFPPDGSLGCAPVGTLVDAKDGSLYGVTLAGGTFNKGTIFRVRRVTALPD